ncbi:helix-turn-helix domain-containing protein [Streptomyces yaizuensis]|uniref:Helix-turn-helix domain-containing protein n=1 Tax=Streptomyces yaizuensis TaxID=2989713 RepID=A0ABQ5P6K5_9ACTN|nr:helix-turn-helix transcriptional regulator [Streptomyces sp. YSPA8]GLF98215.1 helix-turn-helix domain-containing protein [Streptomyces sp. YSPA8]
MSETPYGFDAAKLRAARTAAGTSVARIARAAGVSDRAVSLYLAGSRVPRPEILPRLAAAVGVAPAGLCTIERERLVHLRVWTGRSRAAMATALGMAEETYRHLEITGERGRLSASRYDSVRECWVLWQDRASPAFGVAPGRLLAALRATHDHGQAERAEQRRQWQEQHPEQAAMIDRIARELKDAPVRPGSGRCPGRR